MACVYVRMEKCMPWGVYIWGYIWFGACTWLCAHVHEVWYVHVYVQTCMICIHVCRHVLTTIHTYEDIHAIWYVCICILGYV